MSLDAITPTPAVAAVTGVRTGTGSDAALSSAPVPGESQAPKAAARHDASVHAAELESARQAANRNLRGNGRELAFEFDDASGRMIARLIDTKTKEVLRQYPSKETLAIARALAEDRSQGVLLQTNA
jgi:flagellar protein FlaG